ncbi:MAG: 50S ribosomal protein L4 [Candidatus Dadabacteria bacterium]|nr:50S ribosomal protein L4 [Candidatus Dadabacteria bacterium]MCZ6528246.1 50S ribosomal protein L4 [Candidatus Dadabacteria bacterium]MCZ6554562.1 50S ribosomal protein L4 [Candidatus Dadabacteria bacterium]MCZ6639839.1 50S ribosomal protein L4 [Candidatus Dadabacteria bacterium]MCZ6685758.1 50S ribosomal protein L4 [Candidatus Dadabacteria bacterium]
MPQLDVYDIEKSKVGNVDLDPSIFEAPVKQHLLHAIVNWQLAKRRSGTASTKTKGEVRGGGAKPWKQKHMGRARQGSIRAPQWRKGGVVFGPKPKDWSYNVNKKTKRQALISALSLKYSKGVLIALNQFNLPEIKTKQVADFVKRFELKSALIVVSGENENLLKSAKNLKNIKVIQVDGLNVYDLLKFENLIVTEESLARAQEVLKH